MDIAIIGGGAAGYFSAISAKQHYPEAEVVIFEKSQNVLSKVKISGGGRCNVTNGAQSVSELSKAYPRGSMQLKKLFKTFSNKDTMEWFQSRGVPLVTQEDNCVFPEAQDSQIIIDSLTGEAEKLGIYLKKSSAVESIQRDQNKLVIKFKDPKLNLRIYDKIIVTTGGSPQRKGLDWLANLGHCISDPVPSLFTFNMPDEQIRKLMGVVVENAIVRIPGTKLEGSGPLLITHWGMSGPAILILSSFGARTLSEQDYNFQTSVNWTGNTNAEEVKEVLLEIISNQAKKQLANFRPYLLPERLWHFLLEKTGIEFSKKWEELGKKGLNKLLNSLTNDIYHVKGKTSFRDEFVTCGGVSLQSVNMQTMESKHCPNLYFAGEVLDIDGITGGYNFQAAWTTGFIAGKLNH